jgi:hypothetical protein
LVVLAGVTEKPIPLHMLVFIGVIAGVVATFNVYVAVAAAHGLLETVMVKVTVFPASPAAAV